MEIVIMKQKLQLIWFITMLNLMITLMSPKDMTLANFGSL